MDFLQQFIGAIMGHPQQHQQHQQNNAPTLNVRSAPSMPTDPNMQQHKAAGQPIDPQRYARFNIPVGQPIPQSAMNQYDPQTRKMAEIYQSNPRDPRVSHLDPAIFGYAPDQTVQSPTFRMYEDQTFQGNPKPFMQQNPGYKFYEDNSFQPPAQQPKSIQGYNQNDLSNGIQGGRVNQGYIPLQNSGFGGPGYVANNQPTYNPQQNNSDPMAQLRHMLGL